MTMSDRERRALDDLARRLAAQDPHLASALQSWPDQADVPRAPGTGHRGRAAERWRRKLQQWHDAPARTSITGGLLVVGVLFVAANLPSTDPPVPAAESGIESGVAIFTEQIPAPVPGIGRMQGP